MPLDLMHFCVRDGDGYLNVVPLPTGVAEFRTEVEPTEEDLEFIRSNLERLIRKNRPPKRGSGK